MYDGVGGEERPLEGVDPAQCVAPQGPGRPATSVRATQPGDEDGQGHVQETARPDVHRCAPARLRRARLPDRRRRRTVPRWRRPSAGPRSWTPADHERDSSFESHAVATGGRARGGRRVGGRERIAARRRPGRPAPAIERQWWTLVAVCGATFMLLVDITIVQVALPTMQRSLHASFSDLQWVISAYALSMSALILTQGSLADRFGRKRIFIIGLAVFTLASLACGLARSPSELIAARAVQGIGGAAMFATSLALIAQDFQGSARSAAIAVWGATVGRCGGHRPARRRRPHERLRLAVDLLRERPHRGADPPRQPCAW